jgi:hypothetical protein
VDLLLIAVLQGSHNSPFEAVDNTLLEATHMESSEALGAEAVQMNMTRIFALFRNIFKGCYRVEDIRFQHSHAQLQAINEYTLSIPDEFLSTDLAEQIGRTPQLPYYRMFEYQKNIVMSFISY